MCPWGPRSLLRVSKWTAGACVASSPDSDLEAFRHNPAYGSFVPLAFQPSMMTNGVNKRFLSSELAIRRTGKAPEGTVPSPSPDQHAATRSHCGNSSSSTPTDERFGTGTPMPALNANPFPEVMDSFCRLPLPILFHRPEVSTQFGTITRFSVHPASPVLLTKNGLLGVLDSVAQLHKAAASLTPKSDERLACQYRCGPPPEFPLAFPRSGIVHYLSCPDRYAHTRTLLRRSRSVSGAPLGGIPPISFLTPYGFTRPLTRTYVRLLGPFFKKGQMGIPQARVYNARMSKHPEARAAYHNRGDSVPRPYRELGLWTSPINIVPRFESISEPAHPHSTSNRGSLLAPILFPPDNFNHSLTLFSKSFSSFPYGTCSLSFCLPYLALDGNHRPIWDAFPNNLTRR
ncbi:Protein TAR1 [Capsicum chinense]|nr:Protein TAR1 [Capsicum chinense]